MDKIKQILTKKKLTASDKDIRVTIKKYGLDANNISDADALAVVTELEELDQVKPIDKQITKSESSATVSNPPTQADYHAQLRDAVTPLIRQSQEKVNAFSEGVHIAGEKWKEQKIQELLGYVHSLPSQVADTIAQQLGETGDLNSFRESGESIFNNMLDSQP